MSIASDPRLAAWDASDEGEAAEAAWVACYAARAAAWDAVEAVWAAARVAAGDAEADYYAARDAYLAKTTTPETP